MLTDSDGNTLNSRFYPMWDCVKPAERTGRRTQGPMAERIGAFDNTQRAVDRLEVEHKNLSVLLKRQAF